MVADFINETNLDAIEDKPSILDEFYQFAQGKQQQEAEALIEENGLNTEAAKRYLMLSLKREYASENGTDLNSVLPKMSPLNPNYLTAKQSISKKLLILWRNSKVSVENCN
ncbi:Type I restriction enzyme EcoR124II R protein [Moraxella ovis]|nr:Type I restriction enzyme EcoR124II R protein [Moraxella ovis]